MKNSLVQRFSIILSWISYLHLVECQGSRLQGDADQINSYDDQHWGIRANDDNYSSFSWTRDNNNTWWRIRLNVGPKLISKIEIHNRPRNAAGTHQYNDLAKIYILTSNAVLGKSVTAYFPSPTSEYWTIQSYQEEPYGPVGIIQFNPPVSATWVAVFSENNARLALAQVEVYDSPFQPPSLNLTLVSTDVDSVTITWTPVTAQTVAHYEYKCTDKDWTVHNVNRELPVTVSGYGEETDVVCTVIAVVNSSESQQESAAITTGSAKPVNIARQGTATQIDSLDNNEVFHAESGNNGNYDDFSHTDSNDGSWWRVDLHREFFIGIIELFNRQGGNSEGLYYDSLNNISILTSTTNSVPPCRNCLQWAEQSYQVEPYGPVGIIQFNPQIYARYLAVYRSTPNSSLALAEVEIYVSASVDELITLTLSPCGSTCIDLEWTTLQGTNGNILRYEYKCGGSNWVSVSSDVTFARACGVTPSMQVTCTVMAVVEGDASQEVHRTIQTGDAGSCNIAYKKYTHQLDNFDAANRFPANLAVNGIIDDASDFTHTSGSNSGDKWWRLDLGVSYQIGRIELYNRLGDPGGEAAQYYYRLVKISVLTSDIYSPGPPSLSAPTWTRRDGPNSKAYGPIRVIEFSSQISARHVAVYSESTEPLALTEVTVYESNSLTKSLNSQLTNTSSDCMEFSWTQPQLAAIESIGRYEWNCTDKEWIIATGNEQSFNRTSCDYQPYTNVTCIVAVIISNGASQMETRSAYTSCANPDPPDVAAIRDIVKEKSEELGRETWKYTITWNPPSRVNCHGTISYTYNKNNTAPTEETDDTTHTVHLDGGQLYNFTIWSRNSHGQSTPVVRVWSADELIPQFEETDVRIDAVSPQCIELVVKPPSYPGGTLTTFTSKCDKEYGWSNHSPDIRTSRVVCAYSLYTSVNCVVWAENAAGVKTENRSFNITCTAISIPEFIAWSYLRKNNQSEEVNIDISLKYLGHHCDSLLEYRIIIRESESSKTIINNSAATPGNLTYSGFKPYTNYSVEVVAVRNDGETSTSKKIVLSAEKKPDTAPHISSVESTASCMEIKVRKPFKPNGLISEYQFNCTSWSNTNNQKVLAAADESGSVEMCGFSPGTNVTCSVAAFNKAGKSPPVFINSKHTENNDVSTAVIGLSAGLSVALVAVVILSCIVFKLVKDKSRDKKESLSRHTTAGVGNNNLVLEFSSPTASSTDNIASPPIYMNKAFEKDTGYEVVQSQPAASDHVYAIISSK